MESNPDALFHINVSVTRGMEVMPESYALTDVVSDEKPLAILLGLFGGGGEGMCIGLLIC